MRRPALRSEKFANRVRRGCSRAGEKTFTPGKATPRALLGQRHRGGQLRPVAALAAFDLDEFRDLLADVSRGVSASMI